MEILWDSCYTGSLALSGIFPEQELGADALFERGIVQVIAEAEIEHRHAAGDEADDIVVTLAALLLAPRMILPMARESSSCSFRPLSIRW